MSRTLFYCRIALSAVCGIACLLLIGLCVRSYWRLDSVRISGKSVTSINGRLLTNEVFNLDRTANTHGLRVSTYRTGEFSFWTAPIGLLVPVGLGRSHYYFFYVLVFAVIGTVSWAPLLPKRFSLRTLLVAMTLVALILGLIVWLK